MSWGATAFTPIVMYNEPPFGFHEVQNPSDFPTCPENPYVSTFNLKRILDQKLTNNSKNIPASKSTQKQIVTEYFAKKKNKLCWFLLFIILFYYCF